MTSTRYLALAAIALSLPACSTFKKKDPNYDTPDGGGYDTSNPYGTPDAGGGEGVPYQPVNPPATANPTYSPAAYEDNTAQATPAAAAHATPAAASPAGSHIVVKGDTLGGIARKYGTTSAAIKQANGMTSDTVVLGKTLAIPGGGSAPASRPAAAHSSGGKTHTVVKGDSLAKISRQHGVTVEALKKANSMTNDTVVLGTKLRIP
ncbi:LysM peptidoglycan-binding domain-containing protein [Luteolibacter sp. Populi]|uniref:LysM peptidoglycan-binding domain-containing protein n=1 Tax=Luteolibacter sp. Populi TaxID=3230487 RepID=UPI003466DCBC